MDNLNKLPLNVQFRINSQIKAFENASNEQLKEALKFLLVEHEVQVSALKEMLKKYMLNP